MNKVGGSKRVAVVGAGAVGLVAALRLAERGYAVTVFERDSRPGGLASTFEPVAGGDALERFYHHIFRTDVRFIELIRELGLARRLRWHRTETVCVREGKTERLDSLRSLATFSMLPVLDRARLGVALAVLKLTPLAAPFETRAAASWLRRVAGRRAYETVFEPLFSSKFGEYAERISLAWLWARIHDRTASLGYLDGGFGAVYQALVDRIVSLGGNVMFDRPVTSIARHREGSFEVASGAFRSPERFDRVVSTVPIPLLAKLCPALPPSYAERYGATPNLGARCVILALDRPLTGSYWTNVCDRSMPFTVVVEHTHMISPERYGGRHLVYLGNYGSYAPRSVDELIAEFVPSLQRLNRDFDRSWIGDAWVFAAPVAQPVVEPGFGNRVPPLETPLPGLLVGTLAQTYPHDRGQNYAVALGETIVREIVRRDRPVSETLRKPIRRSRAAVRTATPRVDYWRT
jgi:protoporphyrinogen oxidase